MLYIIVNFFVDIPKPKTSFLVQQYLDETP